MTAIDQNPQVLGWDETEALRQLHIIGAPGADDKVGREHIDRLEGRIVALLHDGTLARSELIVTHHFADGLYARELYIPERVVLTGKVHKFEHINILSKGHITVWTEEGMRRIQAPYVLVSKPGTKRAGFAHSDCIWITIHANPTNDRDPFSLENSLVEQFKLKGEPSWLLD